MRAKNLNESTFEEAASGGQVEEALRRKRPIDSHRKSYICSGAAAADATN